MSDLQRSFAKTQLSRLPPPEPAIPALDERDEDEAADADDDGLLRELPSIPQDDSSSSASSTGTIVPSPTKNLFTRPHRALDRSRDSATSPLPWQNFFSRELFFERGENPSSASGVIQLNHHAYLTPPASNGPLFITHHGAGSSGLSFAMFARELLRAIPGAGMLSIDARGHGQTTIKADTDVPLDLSLATLAVDLMFVYKSARKLLSNQDPPVILIGHSLGGAVITHVAHGNTLGQSLLGYAVLDVVEGSAMDALQSMESYLQTRPRTFKSLAAGIEWHTRSRTIRNSTSARVSVPPLLVEDDNEHGNGLWRWRTDLAATKPFWENWFVDLSKKFLGGRGGKLLLLAGTDRLDKELMIGQMQGKYQLQVFPEAGHFLHEDQPEKTALVVADFYRRNDRSKFVMPPKVDDLIKQGKIKSGTPK